MDSERRSFLATSLGIVALLQSPGLHSMADTSSPVSRLPTIDDLSQTPSFETFYTLSLILTSQDKLHKQFAKKIYNTFLDEPWSAKHLNTVIRTIKQHASDNNTFDLHTAMQDGLFADNETWFISHLLYTWFTGVYYYTGKDRRLSYQHALINTVLGDLYVTPTFSHYQPGFWAKAPDSKL